MNTQNTLIEEQYNHSGLFEDILGRLITKGVPLDSVSREHVSGIDEFHLRGAEVSKELVAQFNFKDLTVLDVGCGLGGPCRMLADEFNCDVHGIDMNKDYILTAQKISKLIPTNGSTTFVKGDALDLPYEDGFFDVVWTQHVQMNIEDKITFYSEIKRVLKDRGAFIYYDIFKKNDLDIYYPVPWANIPSISHLQTIQNMDDILSYLEFHKTQTSDQTQGAISFLQKALKKTQINNHIGLNILLGELTNEKLNNVLKSLNEGKIEIQSGIYKK